MSNYLKKEMMGNGWLVEEYLEGEESLQLQGLEKHQCLV